MSNTQNPFTDFQAWSDYSTFFEQYKNSPMDMKALLETNRKNMLAMSEIQKTAASDMQSLITRQNEIISQLLESNTTLAKEIMSEGTPEEKMAKNTDIFKSMYERTLTNMSELSDMMNTSSEKTTAIINKRAKASMTELQSSLEKTSKKAA
jgi:phasin family protein